MRTELQQLWAEWSEKLSDVIDSAIKYGGGDESMREGLAGISKTVARVESFQESNAELLQMSSSERFPSNLRKQVAAYEEDVRAINLALANDLLALINSLPKWKEGNDAVSD